MLEIIKTIAGELSNRGVYINFNTNSIFDLLESQGNNEGDFSLVANRLSTAIFNEVSRIKNTFIPFKNDYKKEVQDILNRTEIVSKVANYNVEVIEIPLVITEMYNRNMIDSNIGKREQPKDILILKLPENGVKNFINFGNELLNKLASSVINKYTEKDLIDLWNRYFTNVSNTNPNILNLTQSPLTKLDEYVVLYGILKVLKEEKQLVNENLSDVKYHEAIDIFFNNVKFAINNAKRIYDTNKKTGLLIYKIEDNTAFVYGETYDKFLDNNPTEAILGMIVKYNGNSLPLEKKMLEDISINKESYISTWNNFIKVETLSNSLKEVNRYKLAYETALVEFLKENVTDDVRDYISITSLGEIHDKLKKLLVNYRDSEILDVNHMTNEIMGHLVLKDSNYHRFIDSMVEFKKLNPELTPDEAATMASINLIVDYVLIQLTTNKW